MFVIWFKIMLSSSLKKHQFSSIYMLAVNRTHTILLNLNYISIILKVEREAQELADHLDVKIFTADIIYHLFDAFIKYREDLKKRKQDEYRHLAVYFFLIMCPQLSCLTSHSFKSIFSCKSA